MASDEQTNAPFIGRQPFALIGRSNTQDTCASSNLPRLRNTDGTGHSLSSRLEAEVVMAMQPECKTPGDVLVRIGSATSPPPQASGDIAQQLLEQVKKSADLLEQQLKLQDNTSSASSRMDKLLCKKLDMHQLIGTLLAALAAQMVLQPPDQQKHGYSDGLLCTYVVVWYCCCFAAFLAVVCTLDIAQDVRRLKTEEIRQLLTQPQLSACVSCATSMVRMPAEQADTNGREAQVLAGLLQLSTIISILLHIAILCASTGLSIMVRMLLGGAGARPVVMSMVAINVLCWLTIVYVRVRGKLY